MQNTKGFFYCKIKRAARFLGCFFILCNIFFPQIIHSQEAPLCDPLPVTISLEHFGNIELPAYLCQQEVFYPVTALFDFLQIKNSVSENSGVIEGFILNQNDEFEIDFSKKEIDYKGKKTTITGDAFIKLRTGYYLRSDIFGKVFGLNNEFNIRTLSSTFNMEIELPAVKEARRKQMRENLKKVRGVLTADTTIYRNRPFFHFGGIDWSGYSSQYSDGTEINSFNVSVGGLLAGGEFTGRFNYHSDRPVLGRNQFYQWKYVDNEKDLLKQISIGKINTNPLVSLYDPVVGIELTNSPSYAKKTYGTYTLSDYTQPNWIVELYINNVLVDYLRADSSGFYSFEVPLTYGNTEINLRFYGPWGEEEVFNTYFNIPYNFISPGDFEYSFKSGLVEDGMDSRYSQLRVGFGLSGGVTLGGGVEHLSSNKITPFIPFLYSSIRLPWGILFSGEYLHGVGVEGDLDFSIPGKFHLELEYNRYDEDQEVLFQRHLEERVATLAFPIRIGKFHASSRFRFQQRIFANSDYTSANWSLSGNVFGLRLNLSNRAFLNSYGNPLVYSQLSTSVRLPGDFIFSPHVEYEHFQYGLHAIRADIRKRFSEKINFLAGVNHNFRLDQTYVNAGISMDIGFSRLNFNGNISENQRSLSQGASGSLFYDPTHNDVTLDDRPVVGRGSIKFKPFLDINANKKRDAGEPPVIGLIIHSQGGGLKEQLEEGPTTFSGLEPYIRYHFMLDISGLERIAWRIDNETMNIFVNPNQMKVIEIPVQVMGEVAGFIYHRTEGIGGVKVNIFNENGELIGSTLTAGDGYFSYMGLESGKYTAKVDPSQMAQLGMKATDAFEFTITNGQDGDYVDNVELNIFDQREEGMLAGMEPSEEARTGRTDADDLVPSGQQEEIFNPSAKVASGDGRSLIKEGLVYKVRLLSTRELLPPTHEKFLRLENISAEKTASGYVYTWGKTSLPYEASRLQEEARQYGFDQATVTHYFNGQPITPEQAFAIRTGDLDDHSIEALLASDPEEAVVVSDWDKKQWKYVGEPAQESQDQAIGQTPKGAGGEITEGLSFKVQILASVPKLEPNDPLFRGLRGVSEQRHDGLYKYTWGSSKNFGEASQMKNMLRAQGFDDAFVVPFYNNRRLNAFQVEGKVWFLGERMTGIGGISVGISDQSGKQVATAMSQADGSFTVPGLEPGNYTAVIDTAQLAGIGMEPTVVNQAFSIQAGSGVSTQRLEYTVVPAGADTSVTATTGVDQGIVFKVQILAAVPKLPVDHRLLKGVEGVTRYRHQGLFKYTVGESRDLQEVGRVKRNMQEVGFEDAFIVPFINGRRMKMQELTGQVLLELSGIKEGLEGIRVNIYDRQGQKVTSLVSDKYGKFSFLGFRPGLYTARLDERQVTMIGLQSRSSIFAFEILRNTEGEIADPAIFVLEEATTVRSTQASGTGGALLYRVQIAASNVPLGPNHPTLKGYRNVHMYKHNGMFKYTIGEATSFEEAVRILSQNKRPGTSAFIVTFRDGKRVSQ